LLRSVPCDDPECAKYSSQCTTLRAVRKGQTKATYANGTAQYHWGVTPADRWALYDVKKDPGCETDIALHNPERVGTMIATCDHWWEEQYPVMLDRGGDAGDPNASRNASSRAQQHAAKVAAQKKRKANQ
jgi:hypothetical protein